MKLHFTTMFVRFFGLIHRSSLSFAIFMKCFFHNIGMFSDFKERFNTFSIIFISNPQTIALSYSILR